MKYEFEKSLMIGNIIEFEQRDTDLKNPRTVYGVIRENNGCKYVVINAEDDENDTIKIDIGVDDFNEYLIGTNQHPYLGFNKSFKCFIIIRVYKPFYSVHEGDFSVVKNDSKSIEVTKKYNLVWERFDGEEI